MDFVGAYIRKKRISKKISLDTVCNELKISKYIIHQIENDELDKSINNTFYIGHLRAYANFLNLNVNEIIEQFKLQNSFENVEILDQIPKPINQNTFFRLNKFLSLTSIIVIFITFYFLFIDVEKPNSDYAIIPDIPEVLEPIVEKELIDIIISLKQKFNLLQDTNKQLISDIKIAPDQTKKNYISTETDKNKKEMEALTIIMNKVDTYRRNTFAYMRDKDSVEKIINHIQIYRGQCD